MNNLLALGALVCVMTATSPAYAQQKPDEHAGHHPTAETPVASSKQETRSTQGMQSSMKKMQEVMSKIQASKDPKEVALLLGEHMKLMREQMKGMRGMMSEGKMGKGMMGGKQDASSASKDGDMMKHHEMMMEHMEMMHGMMEQMMEHMSAEHHMMKRDIPQK
jgi:periplasmic protein CpxP/Spy